MRLTLTLLVFLASSTVADAHAVFVDFDLLAAGTHAGNVLEPFGGVTFTTGTVPDAASVGDVITLAGAIDGFEVLENSSAISPPNFAMALGGGGNDLLMAFPFPVRGVQLFSDQAAGEAPDLIRLVALAATGIPNEFQVLAFHERLDDAVASPNNLLFVHLGGPPFQFALFQTTTEQEGFDNLLFVPEPATLVTLGIGVAGALRRRRRAA